MSTRLERLADRATNEKHTKILVGLLQQPYNRTCADCRKKDPRWASWNLGIFVCIHCSGIHRSLGTHISKVKSVDLDTWIPEQVESMVQWGNQRANTYWEEKLGDNQPPEGSMEKWIRAKYEQKRWVSNETVPRPMEIEVKEYKSNIAVDNQLEKAQTTKNNNIELGHHHHTSISSNERKSTDSESRVSPKEKTLPKTTSSFETLNPKSTSTKENQSCKFDLDSFQKQLSLLAVGRPSTGLIPKAPEGSDRSWENLIVPSKMSKAFNDEARS